MLKLFSKSFLICLMIIQHLHAQNPEGWHWYKETPEQSDGEETLAITPQKPSISPQKEQAPSSWDLKLKSLQKQHDEALAQAIMNLTPQSVEKVLVLQKEMMQRALSFQKMWGQVLLQKGEAFMDPEINPNSLHKKIQEQEHTQKLSLALKRLSKQYGLFLALKKDCPYCEAFVPIAQEFASLYGFELLGIGDVVASSYKIKILQDNGVLSLINPEHKYPALFLVNIKQKEVWPLAWGLSSLPDLHINAEIVVNQITKGGGV